MKSDARARILGGLTLLIFVFVGFAYQENMREGVRSGRYTIPELTEPSGLVRSRQYPDVFWTHNDSGGAPEIFATSSSGTLLGRFLIADADARDWEAITADRSGHLYIGDIGNNANMRKDLAVYKIHEPNVETGPTHENLTVLAKFPFFYPEQKAFPEFGQRNFDSEALFWATHPETGQGTLYLLTKHRSDQRTALYRFEDLSSNQPQGLTKIGETHLDGLEGAALVTGVAISEDERIIAVLNYSNIYLFERPPVGDNYLAHHRHTIRLKPRLARQAEAIAWDGSALIFTNEQLDVFRIEDPFMRIVAP